MFLKRLLFLPLLIGSGLYSYNDFSSDSEMSEPLIKINKIEGGFYHFEYLDPKDFMDYFFNFGNSENGKKETDKIGYTLYRELKFLQTFAGFPSKLPNLKPLPASVNIEFIGKNIIDRLEDITDQGKDLIKTAESLSDKEKTEKLMKEIEEKSSKVEDSIRGLGDIADKLEKSIGNTEELKKEIEVLKNTPSTLQEQFIDYDHSRENKEILIFYNSGLLPEIVGYLEKTIAQLKVDFGLDPTAKPEFQKHNIDLADTSTISVPSNPSSSSLENTSESTGLIIENTDKTSDAFLPNYAEIKAYVQMAQELIELKKEIVKIIQNEQDVLFRLSSNISSNMNKLNFASSLATNSRLVKLSNPYSQDEKFAQWIERVKYQHLADNSTPPSNLANNSTSGANYLSNTIYGYDYLRFNHPYNVWGNIGTIIGNSDGMNSASGVVSVGYDTWIKNMIFGVYGSYSYTSNNIASSDSKNKSHNGDIGLYSRFFIGNNEIDINLGENIGFNMLSLKETLIDKTFESNYFDLQTHLDLSYGYVFNLSKGWFSKPFIGVNYNYGYNLGVNANDGNFSVGWDGFQTQFISGQVGVEFRKYTSDNESYFFIAPAIYQGALLANTQSIQTKIYGIKTNKGVNESNKNNLDTSFILKAGGEWKVRENIYVNISAGTKLGNINQYGILNIGGRMVF